jgi:hypothetical protein
VGTPVLVGVLLGTRVGDRVSTAGGEGEGPAAELLDGESGGDAVDTRVGTDGSEVGCIVTTTGVGASICSGVAAAGCVGARVGCGEGTLAACGVGAATDVDGGNANVARGAGIDGKLSTGLPTSTVGVAGSGTDATLDGVGGVTVGVSRGVAVTVAVGDAGAATSKATTSSSGPSATIVGVCSSSGVPSSSTTADVAEALPVAGSDSCPAAGCTSSARATMMNGPT